MPETSERTRPPRWLLDAALVVLALIALVVLTTRDRSPGIEVEHLEAPGGLDELRVDVAGAVAHPGVVTVALGARIADALALAGGPTIEADTAPLNLSRRLVDEDHVIVPRISDRRSALLNLNIATSPQLEALPAIGKITADAILASRTRDGLFMSTDDLVSRGLLPARSYEQVRDLVTTR
ncbi:MAG: SLBB domain-containing protein [Chloroflexota bacterium]